MDIRCWQSGRQEDWGRAAAREGTCAEERLERRVGSSGLCCTLAVLYRSLRGDFHADVRFAVEAAAPGAAALGRQVLRVDAVCGAGGASDPGATGPDPGGGEASHVDLFAVQADSHVDVDSQNRE